MKHPSISFYNTLSRKNELFKPIKKDEIRLYTCGPTVYNYAHIGNLRTYIFEDLLERTFLFRGYRVKRVMNITDVGHLTGDSDAGEDKVEKEAREKKKTVSEIVRFYTKAFLEDMRKLNIRIPKLLAPATKYIPEQIELVKTLIKKGYAYETDEAVYFDVTKFKKYGELSGQLLKEKIVAARSGVIADSQKRNPADFALWFKLVGKFKNHVLRWPSPWGDGFPGWHVECSAIGRALLGQPFDMHTGGVDLIGTHHTNEIAQSEAAYAKPLARYWLHGEFLLIDDTKMAKSEQNFLTLKELQNRHIHPLAFRYLCLTAHYRSPLHFSWGALEHAQNALRGVIGKVLLLTFQASRVRSKSSSRDLAQFGERFLKYLANDLDIPGALALVHDLFRKTDLVQRAPGAVLKTIFAFDEVFGLSLRTFAHRYAMSNLFKKDVSVRKFVEQREAFRTHQQFMQADRLRKEINRLGYVLEDTPSGPFVWPRDILKI